MQFGKCFGAEKQAFWKVFWNGEASIWHVFFRKGKTCSLVGVLVWKSMQLDWQVLWCGKQRCFEKEKQVAQI